MIWLVLLYVPMTAGGGGAIQTLPMQSVEQCQAAGQKVVGAADKLFRFVCVEGAKPGVV
jgi:hypothetical protein